MKTLIYSIFSCFFIISTNLIAQDLKEQSTKMDAFVSKTGTIIKFIDYSLADLKLNYGIAETKIRKVISGGESKFFYQISKKGQYNTKTASIAYEDLLEVLKALESLKLESQTDNTEECDYLENRFVTEDGFQIGYFLSKGKINWCLVLERYGSDNTIFPNDYQAIESAFKHAKIRIEELTNQL